MKIFYSLNGLNEKTESEIFNYLHDNNIDYSFDTELEYIYVNNNDHCLSKLKADVDMIVGKYE